METHSGHKSIPQKSPNYPSMSFQEAISKAKILYEKDGKVGAPKKSALEHLGYKVESGASARTLSALRKYDLIADQNGRIVLTQHAIDLLVYPKESERYRAAIKHCSLSPKIYRTLWDEYGNGFPSDQTLKAELIDRHNFNPNQVAGFLKDFKNTIEFAGLSSEDTGERLKIGDYVRWESQGAIQFESKRITGVSDDGNFAFIEGSNTGLPMDQLMKVTASHGEEAAAASSNNPFAGLRPQAITPHTGAWSGPGRTSGTMVSTNTFPIPLKRQNQAMLSFARMPLEKSDLELLKSWIDLMGENLTEALPQEDRNANE
jgi:hypothetical protein